MARSRTVGRVVEAAAQGEQKGRYSVFARLFVQCRPGAFDVRVLSVCRLLHRTCTAARLRRRAPNSVSGVQCRLLSAPRTSPDVLLEAPLLQARQRIPLRIPTDRDFMLPSPPPLPPFPST